MKENKKLYIVCICFIILITATSITKIMQNDTYFTIATGNEIISNGYDNMDHLTFHEGLSFYKLRWAFDVTIASIYNVYGFTGIYVFIIGIACIIGITLFNILLKQKNNIIIAFITTIIAVIFTSKYGFTGRAQIISYLLLLLEIFFIEKLIKTEKKTYLLPLFILSVLIVNFHASVWYMTIILILPYLAEAIIYKIANKKDNKQEKQTKFIIENINIKLLIGAILVLILGSFFSRIGTYTYTYMFKNLSGLSSEFIAELQPSNITTSVGMATLLILFVGIAIGTKTRIKVSDLFLFSGLFFMAILAGRNQFYLYIIGIIPIARLITNLINTYDNEKLLEKATIFLQKTKSIMVLTALVAIVLLNNCANRINEEYIDTRNYPVQAVNYIKENIDYKNLRVYNHFDFGSYLEFSGIQAFVDSRSEIFCEEFNNTTILQDWLNVIRANVHYEEIFEKYNIDYALIKNNTIEDTYLEKDSNYIQIYEDEYFSIHMKKEIYNNYDNIKIQQYENNI